MAILSFTIRADPERCKHSILYVEHTVGLNVYKAKTLGTFDAVGYFVFLSLTVPRRKKLHRRDH